jgi:hypothetical protein
LPAKVSIASRRQNRLVLWVNRRVRSIRDLQAVVVVGLVGLAGPLLLDGWQHRAAVHEGEHVRHGLRGPVADAVEDAWVRGIEVAKRSGPLAHTVTGARGDVGEDVGAYVPAAEGVEAPAEG